ncbi:hypothetical protein [Hymenobacter translucens]|uniref:hypothetical protein n=1 Tax=Hymenobacter translucens TaxID=2886507 RepID=UPI001D0F0E6F|nr:hypothetical protein [Hymenobacter translucens]
MFLLISLSENKKLLFQLVHECRAAVEAGGGVVIEQLPKSLLLSWPAGLGEQQALPAYQLLRASLQRMAPQAQLHGAASLGWVKVRPSQSGGHRYRGEVLRQVAGILLESVQLGSGLLIAAVLYQRLDRTAPFRYQLHVGFEVAGHRYPATLFQVTADNSC